MLQQCNHPNVVRYLGSYQGEEYLWVGKPYWSFAIMPHGPTYFLLDKVFECYVKFCFSFINEVIVIGVHSS